MTNITLCTKVNLLFLCNIELNTNDTQMNENLFSIIFINDKANIITLSDWEFQFYMICILNYNIFLCIEFYCKSRVRIHLTGC